MRIDPKLTVVEIARRHPETLPVFAKYRIDLCCGGAHPLEFVSEKHHLDLKAVMRELEASVKP